MILKFLVTLAAIKVFVLPALLLAEQDPDALSEAMKALSEALTAGGLNPIMAVVAGLAIAAILVLKALGKNVPFVDPLVKVVLDVAKKLTKKAPPPAETPGAAGTVEVEKLSADAEKTDEK